MNQIKLYTDSQLDYMIDDIVAARDIAGQWGDSGVGERKYSDQLDVALQERHRRQGKDRCPCCKRPL